MTRDYQPTDLAGQARSEASKEALERAQAEERKADLKFVMQHPQGRRFVWRLLEAAGIYRTTFVPSTPDKTAFLEGMRNLGLMTVAEIEAVVPEQYDQMKKEQRKA